MEREREQMKITQFFYISERTVRLRERRFSAFEMTHRSLMQKLRHGNLSLSLFFFFVFNLNNENIL